MTDNITYLSPNGQNVSYGSGTVTRMLVGTIDGVVMLERKLRGKPWVEASRGLKGLHISALLCEPSSGRLFAGCHADGGLWVSDRGTGDDWRELTDGLAHRHIYTLAMREDEGRVTLFAGTSPAALYRSDDLGESWGEIKSLTAVPGSDKWTFIPPPHHPHVKNIVFHPTQPGT